MRAIDIIIKKRDGKSLEKSEIEFFLNSYLDGSIPDYQVSAFLMAVIFKGMEKDELLHFTQTMTNSGEIINFPNKKKFVIDKHSTGGVGDKTSIALAPLLASMDIGVAKLSGRGLGFTGGTIDKFESIEGFKFKTSAMDMLTLLEETGIGLMGYSDTMVPLDKKLYSLRDVTGTVPSIPLIASSIMSKKLALETDAILLDVKVGNGAFMKTPELAKELALQMYDIGIRAGRKISCLLTNMNQPLGSAVGNSLELIEAVETLKDNGPEDFTQLILYLAGASLMLKGEVSNIEEGISHAKTHLGTATPLKFLSSFIEKSGGNGQVVHDYSLLKSAKNEMELLAEQDGCINAFKTDDIGLAAMLIGAGRKTKEDIIDHSVGLKIIKKQGDMVKKGDCLVKIFYNSNENLDSCIETLKNSISISTQQTSSSPLIIDHID